MQAALSWAQLLIGFAGFGVTFPMWLLNKISDRAMIGLTLALSWWGNHHHCNGSDIRFVSEALNADASLSRLQWMVRAGCQSFPLRHVCEESQEGSQC